MTLPHLVVSPSLLLPQFFPTPPATFPRTPQPPALTLLQSPHLVPLSLTPSFSRPVSQDPTNEAKIGGGWIRAE